MRLVAQRTTSKPTNRNDQGVRRGFRQRRRRRIFAHPCRNAARGRMPAAEAKVLRHKGKRVTQFRCRRREGGGSQRIARCASRGPRPANESREWFCRLYRACTARTPWPPSLCVPPVVRPSERTLIRYRVVDRISRAGTDVIDVSACSGQFPAFLEVKLVGFFYCFAS